MSNSVAKAYGIPYAIRKLRSEKKELQLTVVSLSKRIDHLNYRLRRVNRIRRRLAARLGEETENLISMEARNRTLRSLLEAKKTATPPRPASPINLDSSDTDSSSLPSPIRYSPDRAESSSSEDDYNRPRFVHPQISSSSSDEETDEETGHDEFDFKTEQ
ncbi:Oidioi.mRNA.OKI2018_I69.chr1.g3808.t1.cds [Oikopleura dioica]|uniref:Oidioi.mRNA.OKI2018_I69.chr1.g3808.t1.cds n=1 Tax=Oikopleura dioica TaxID=34765 RepID=A0ABN7SVU5_OIKDI|nr:Oidioi.mRNA.OKI2018_I69.chr1.g3808.t1.cds [Oikopleura dioica]